MSNNIIDQAILNGNKFDIQTFIQRDDKGYKNREWNIYQPCSSAVYDEPSQLLYIADQYGYQVTIYDTKLESYVSYIPEDQINGTPIPQGQPTAVLDIYQNRQISSASIKDVRIYYDRLNECALLVVTGNDTVNGFVTLHQINPDGNTFYAGTTYWTGANYPVTYWDEDAQDLYIAHEDKIYKANCFAYGQITAFSTWFATSGSQDILAISGNSSVIGIVENNVTYTKIVRFILKKRQPGTSLWNSAGTVSWVCNQYTIGIHLTDQFALIYNSNETDSAYVWVWKWNAFSWNSTGQGFEDGVTAWQFDSASNAIPIQTGTSDDTPNIEWYIEEDVDTAGNIVVHFVDPLGADKTTTAYGFWDNSTETSYEDADLDISQLSWRHGKLVLPACHPTRGSEHRTFSVWNRYAWVDISKWVIDPGNEIFQAEAVPNISEVRFNNSVVTLRNDDSYWSLDNDESFWGTYLQSPYHTQIRSKWKVWTDFNSGSWSDDVSGLNVQTYHCPYQISGIEYSDNENQASLNLTSILQDVDNIQLTDMGVVRSGTLTLQTGNTFSFGYTNISPESVHIWAYNDVDGYFYKVTITDNSDGTTDWTNYLYASVDYSAGTVTFGGEPPDTNNVFAIFKTDFRYKTIDYVIKQAFNKAKFYGVDVEPINREVSNGEYLDFAVAGELEMTAMTAIDTNDGDRVIFYAIYGADTIPHIFRYNMDKGKTIEIVNQYGQAILTDTAIGDTDFTGYTAISMASYQVSYTDETQYWTELYMTMYQDATNYEIVRLTVKNYKGQFSLAVNRAKFATNTTIALWQFDCTKMQTSVPAEIITDTDEANTLGYRIPMLIHGDRMYALMIRKVSTAWNLEVHSWPWEFEITDDPDVDITTPTYTGTSTVTDIRGPYGTFCISKSFDGTQNYLHLFYTAVRHANAGAKEYEKVRHVYKIIGDVTQFYNNFTYQDHCVSVYEATAQSDTHFQLLLTVRDLNTDNSWAEVRYHSPTTPDMFLDPTTDILTMDPAAAYTNTGKVWRGMLQQGQYIFLYDGNEIDDTEGTGFTPDGDGRVWKIQVFDPSGTSLEVIDYTIHRSYIVPISDQTATKTQIIGFPSTDMYNFVLCTYPNYFLLTFSDRDYYNVSITQDNYGQTVWEFAKQIAKDNFAYILQKADARVEVRSKYTGDVTDLVSYNYDSRYPVLLEETNFSQSNDMLYTGVAVKYTDIDGDDQTVYIPKVATKYTKYLEIDVDTVHNRNTVGKIAQLYYDRYGVFTKIYSLTTQYRPFFEIGDIHTITHPDFNMEEKVLELLQINVDKTNNIMQLKYREVVPAGVGPWYLEDDDGLSLLGESTFLEIVPYT